VYYERTLVLTHLPSSNVQNKKRLSAQQKLDYAATIKSEKQTKIEFKLETKLISN